MRHCSDSETLKQVAQNRTRCLTSISTSANRRTSAGSDCSRWNAIRCAPLGPTPGSRPSSSIRSWTMPSYKSFVRLREAEARWSVTRAAGARHTWHARHAAAGQWTDGVAGHRVGLRLGVAVRRDHEVAEVAQVVVARAVERAGLDRHGLELADAVHGHRHRAGGAVHPGVRELLLGGLELFLHLLRLLQEALQIE